MEVRFSHGPSLHGLRPRAHVGVRLLAKEAVARLGMKAVWWVASGQWMRQGFVCPVIS
jgi:hypothetical protein